MEPKIILRYRSGSKQGQVEEFPLKNFRSLTLGRDVACEITLDADRDDLVSRMHCKIEIQLGPAPVYRLVDLDSRNGTFVARQRIQGEVTLSPGDVIQLGPGGPEIEFDAHPRPAAVPKATRLATEFNPAMIPNAPVPAPVAEVVAPPPGAMSSPGLGKATVERLIADSHRKSRVWQFVAIGILLLAVTGVGVFALVQHNLFGGAAEMATSIAARNTDSVVFFEVGWKIVDIESGRQLYHVAMPNKVTDESGEERQLVPSAPAYLPIFIPTSAGLEPMLSTDDGGGNYRAVGGSHSGSGFVVSKDGFLLTNRHVAAAWQTQYQFPHPVGVALELDGEMNVSKLTPIGANNFPAWIPADAKVVTSGAFGSGNFRIIQKAISGKTIEGRNDYLDVTFARNRVRIPGKLARVSDQIDVAMVKIDIPRSLATLELFDNYDRINSGDEVLVLGYPAASPIVVGAVLSQDGLRRGSEAKVIPDPTLSVGNIGRVIRGSTGSNEGTFSLFGDVYQLTVNSTGPGNSGGPVFDKRGRVIGIFTSGTTGDTKITFAVPIRYGIELMGTHRVM
ncbi:MAG: trypsin-like peptidase domain-containing protein [Bryobacterales bacterium]|nr:trypsin-like peptidase domain-containing protein [Bryobacterales bacterium]